MLMMALEMKMHLINLWFLRVYTSEGAKKTKKTQKQNKPQINVAISFWKLPINSMSNQFDVMIVGKIYIQYMNNNNDEYTL
uniref:Uncharacterized protein n=1 Tax=Anguilla anguilla TaxID=7936 RepID=A0A0E9X690_ANGAN